MLHLFACVREEKPPSASSFAVHFTFSLSLSLLYHYPFAGAQGDPQQATTAKAKGAAASTGHQACRAAGEQVCVFCLFFLEVLYVLLLYTAFRLVG